MEYSKAIKIHHLSFLVLCNRLSTLFVGIEYNGPTYDSDVGGMQEQDGCEKLLIRGVMGAVELEQFIGRVTD